ncbi:ABC transporter substrate-binding protein [Terasakiella sp. SH-1]|uniref:ABC transporter substrate-binding protein n=1 Tax=Terasakiella sp. SH-1 TaxID=2560057 RepID=UPI0010745389|nr:ABC transporter substrate-binding protein [Terasakiella sp. SH-1]
MKKLFAMFVFFVAFAVHNASAQVPSLRAGVLKFGTVNWELQTIKAYGLDKAEGFNLEIVPFAGKQASVTALYGDAVDVIVNDWIWVARQRHEGRHFSFIPYSRMVGAMMADPKDQIKSLPDLTGKKIGIAGGPVDKSWLLFQAVALKEHGFDLAKNVETVFGAPPLLSKKLESGELDAVINFWHFAAKLEAKGFERVLNVADALQVMGLDENVPMIGYVFGPRFEQNMKLKQALSRASRKAKEILATDEQAWAKIKPLMKAKNEATYQALKTGFLNGVPSKWGQGERAGASSLFELLSQLGGTKLVGKAKTIPQGTFVKDVSY